MEKSDFISHSKEISPNDSQWGSHHIWIWKGFSCHWRVLGKTSDRPIVLIHGFGASSEHWRNNAKDLSEAGFCIYAIDLIGFGKSEQPHPKKIRYLENQFWGSQLKDFLIEIVLIHKFKKAILIGNSLGGLVALTSFILAPNLVETLVTAPLPDPALMKNNLEYKYNSKWLKIIKEFAIKTFFYLLPLEIIVPLISRTEIINYALNLAYFKNISSDIELKKIVSKPARKKTAPRALRAMCLGMALREPSSTAPNLLTKLPKTALRPSLLMIWGEEDKLVPLFIGKNLIKQHSWIKLLVIKNTGHCPHDESPKYFNNSILNWLEINLNLTSPKE